MLQEMGNKRETILYPSTLEGKKFKWDVKDSRFIFIIIQSRTLNFLAGSESATSLLSRETEIFGVLSKNVTSFYGLMKL